MICCWSCGSSNVGRPELETLMPFARRKRTDRHPTPASDPSWLLPTPFHRESLFQFYSFCLMTRHNAKNSSPNHPDCANFQESMGGASAPPEDLRRYWRPVSGSGPVPSHALRCTPTDGLAMVARALTGFVHHASFGGGFQTFAWIWQSPCVEHGIPAGGHAPGRESSRNGALWVMNMASDLEIHDAASSSALSGPCDRHFRTLAESLPQIVWLASADCCVGYQNRRWCEYTGLASADSTGSGWKQAVHPDDLPEILRRWERAVRGGEPCELA